MKNKKLVVILSAVLIVLIAGFVTVWKFVLPKANQTNTNQVSSSSSVAGDKKDQKSITVKIISKDKESKDFEITTDKEFLGQALYDEKLVNDSEFQTGFYTEINGVKADYNQDKAWWCVTKDGEMTTVGMNEQVIADGDQFEITYTIG